MIRWVGLVARRVPFPANSAHLGINRARWERCLLNIGGDGRCHVRPGAK